jgi:hypothetical protein
MSFEPDDGTPSKGSVGGSVPQVCTFALELFMIVAFFLFMLFKPIVVLLFQLWWMLALRFCLPPSLTALAALHSHFQGGGTMTNLSATDEANLDDLLGGKGLTDKVAASSTFPADGGGDLVAAVDPTTREQPKPSEPEDPLTDPLCRIED